MSATGGCGNAANVCYKKLASMLASKWDQPYSLTLAWMRCKLSFTLLRSAVHCIRGACSAGGRAFKHVALPADLAIMETNTSSSKSSSACTNSLIIKYHLFLVFIYFLSCL